MAGLGDIGAALSDGDRAVSSGDRAEEHLGSEFGDHIQEHGERLGRIEQSMDTSSQALVATGERITAQDGRLNLQGQAITNQDGRLNLQGQAITNQEGKINSQTDKLKAHDQAFRTQASNLTALDGRVTAMEPRIAANTHLSQDERAEGYQRVSDLQAVRDAPPQLTGHTSYDGALQQRINADPMVQLHRNALDGALQRMQTALGGTGTGVPAAANRAAFEKAASDALGSAKELDAARKGMESTGVFQASNRFSKKSTIVTGAAAGLSIAGAATTGGIIAWNNEKQGKKAN